MTLRLTCRRILRTSCFLVLTATATQAIAGSNPMIRMETTHGTMTIELDASAAPETVSNFLTYVDDGFYDGTIFHRVIPGFMIQGGGFDQDFREKKTRAPITNEADNGLPNLRGTLAMARTSDPHSASSQFFINSADNAFLDHTAKNASGWGYAVFGRVTEGLDVIDRISAEPTGNRGPYQDVPVNVMVILKAERAD